MLDYMKKIATSKVFKPMMKGLFGLFTKKANPQARFYADNVASEVADFVPTVVEVAAAAVAAYQLGGIGLESGLKLATVMADEKSPVKDVVLSPAKMYHHYKNYQFLKGVQDGNYEQTDIEDDFVLIDKKSARLG
jgi:hypothetical protein